jgi:hypothetical protein
MRLIRPCRWIHLAVSGNGVHLGVRCLSRSSTTREIDAIPLTVGALISIIAWRLPTATEGVQVTLLKVLQSGLLAGDIPRTRSFLAPVLD